MTVGLPKITITQHGDFGNISYAPGAKKLPVLPEDAVPVRLGVAFLEGTSLISRMIQRITRSPWSHVALLFDFGSHGIWYYEAMFGKPVRGPLPLEKMLLWREAGRDRRIVQYWLKLPDETVRIKHAVAKTFVNCATYGELQLLAMWAFYRLGIRVREESRRQVCSEYVARILFPECDARRDLGDPIPARNFDECAPGHVYWAVVDFVARVGGTTL